jgi:uncharacterized protein DUF2795
MSSVSPISIQKFLRGVRYPASKQSLVSHATGAGADDRVREALEGLPDAEYATPADVSRAIGRSGRPRDTSENSPL